MKYITIIILFISVLSCSTQSNKKVDSEIQNKKYQYVDVLINNDRIITYSVPVDITAISDSAAYIASFTNYIKQQRNHFDYYDKTDEYMNPRLVKFKLLNDKGIDIMPFFVTKYQLIEDSIIKDYFEGDYFFLIKNLLLSNLNNIAN